MKKILTAFIDQNRGFVVSVVFFACFFAIFTPVFEEVDDVFMMQIVNGNYTGVFDPHIVYMHIYIGILLSSLYGISKAAVNWYSLFLYLNLFIALWFLLDFYYKKFYDTSLQIFFTICVLLFWIVVMLNMQFTIVASFLALSGYIYFLYLFRSRQNVLHWRSGVALLLLILSILIRNQSFLQITLSVLPLFGYIFFTTHGVKKTIVAMFLSLFTLYGILSVINDNFYSKSEWSLFNELRKVNFYIHGLTNFSNYNKYLPVYESIGWSENDQAAYMSWMYEDKAVYSVDKISIAVSGTFALFRSNFFLSSVVTGIGNVGLGLFNRVTFMHSIFLILFLAVYRKRIDRYMGSIAFLSGMIVLFLVGIFGRAIPRVVVPELFFVLLIFVTFMVPAENIKDTKDIISREVNQFLRVFLVFSMCCIVFLHYMESEQYRGYQDSFKSSLTELGSDPKSLIILYPGWATIPIHKTSVWNTRYYYPPSSIIWLSWLQQSPHDEKIYKKHAQTDLYGALISKGNVVIVAPERWLVTLKEYYREHLNKKVEYTVVKKLQKDTVNVYKLTEVR